LVAQFGNDRPRSTDLQAARPLTACHEGPERGPLTRWNVPDLCQFCSRNGGTTSGPEVCPARQRSPNGWTAGDRAVCPAPDNPARSGDGAGELERCPTATTGAQFFGLGI